MRRFLERCRKLTKKSPKHWCCTELGEENGRIHLHGIFWCEKELILKCWQYGYVYIGEYVNEKTIMYITKYMLKINEKRPDFKGKVLSSAGIGKGYLNRKDSISLFIFVILFPPFILPSFLMSLIAEKLVGTFVILFPPFILSSFLISLIAKS